METKQKAVLGVVGLALIGAGAFAYFTYVSRPLPPPSKLDTQNNSIDTGDQNSNLVGNEVTYVVDPSKTWAKFEIDETLYGKPKHVEGITSDVTGQITLNTTNPSLSKVGTFRINARTLKTDEPKRDNTVGRMILKSADPVNEFIIFEATETQDMPVKITEAEQFTFKIPGKLTVAGVTRDVTFQGKATLQGGILTGNAESIIKYQDFGMEIPKLKFLAWVDDKVKLSINFVGVAK